MVLALGLDIVNGISEFKTCFACHQVRGPHGTSLKTICVWHSLKMSLAILLFSSESFSAGGSVIKSFISSVADYCVQLNDYFLFSKIKKKYY